ncbi:LPXTG cell wall anchor domain-containing protein [Corynebacterium pseudodiphtheriticum]|uniref:LPXTG cell wall anchor domain-containing protein n=1 Tax=Corynebacterium pseudodiphtheriticum TaxID=37637 RepID=UPI00254D4BA2|nr:LPXTG cell wall anchor domain-containing protein [Corynebacterium pseudodiphtheriticum]MDK8486077.1 LPXTG cell wall anchor domain-containing protein [Corynebacterium pseudodiphtheriticum]MDK8493310.1 LPXTG cell wall anchor domain-containing protein [Corynebacterium pseudodiphtheriticum]
MTQTFHVQEYENVPCPELPKTGDNGIWNFVLGGLLLVIGDVLLRSGVGKHKVHA